MLQMTFMRVNSLALLLTGGFLATVSSCDQAAHQPPNSPEEALSAFQLQEGFRIELVASEPLIRDPVEVAFDEHGRMYVVQMDDYPSEEMEDWPAGHEPKSRISLLEDKDGDGYYESATLFAEGLHYANGVMPWEGGVLVTSAPDILFLKDTDGDGKADVKKVVVTGFAETNPQLRMGSLRYGLDNWIYGAYAHTGGGKWRKEFKDKGNPLSFPDKPALDIPKIFPGTNFRLQPDSFMLESSGGSSQFGLSFDAAGNQFTVYNNVHIRPVVINDKYFSNNPFVNEGNGMASISDHGDAAVVYPITKNMLNLHESEVGHFTSACGICEYTGGLFKGPYAKASFVCEPVSNLVHSDILTPNGATFVATRTENEKEFLSSTDSWFRPVNLTVGPDGALYVVDFYRKLVEHPDWLDIADSSGFYTYAGQIKESDFLEGNDRGRIYRIVPKDLIADRKKIPDLGKAGVEDLVACLNDPNSWKRSNAQRLLVGRRDVQAVPLITNLLSGDISPEGAIHALWTLEGLGALSDTLLGKAFENNSSVVRRQAVLLGEKRMDQKQILEKILKASSDPDPAVQFQVALTLSNIKNPDSRVFQAQGRIISSHLNDTWFQTAILLGASENALQWFEDYKDYENKTDSGNAGKQQFLKKILSVVGARYRAGEVSSVVKMISEAKDTGSVTASNLEGLAAGMRRNRNKMQLTNEGQRGLIALISNGPPKVKEAAIGLASRLQLMPSGDLTRMINNAKAVAADPNSPIESRVFAVRIMGLDRKAIPFGLLEKELAPDEPSDVQLAAVNVLLNSQDQKVTNILLGKWNTFVPKIREAVEAGFLARPGRLRSLMEDIENKKIEPASISRNTQNRLLRHSDSAISEKAKTLFSELGRGSRDKVIIDYNISITTTGDIEKGRMVFKRVCSTCHVLDGVGVSFGPDLHSVSHRTKINLLSMILDPNHDISAGYEGYTIETTDGALFAGIIENENTTGIMLKSPGNHTQNILRSNIKSILPMPVSLMPEGLEAQLEKEDMANLLEFIKGLK